jgi:hypothetical protein
MNATWLLLVMCADGVACTGEGAAATAVAPVTRSPAVDFASAAQYRSGAGELKCQLYDGQTWGKQNMPSTKNRHCSNDLTTQPPLMVCSQPQNT